MWSVERLYFGYAGLPGVGCIMSRGTQSVAVHLWLHDGQRYVMVR
jgi:hypothetical protein